MFAINSEPDSISICSQRNKTSILACW